MGVEPNWREGRDLAPQDAGAFYHVPPGACEAYISANDKYNDPGKHFHTGPVVFANDKDKLKEKEGMKELANPVERKLYVLGRELKPMNDIELINHIGTIDDKITLREKLAEQSTRIAKYVQDLREGRKLVMKELDSREDAE